MISKCKFLFLLVLLVGAFSCSPKGDDSISEVIVNGNKMYVSELNSINSKLITLPLSKLVEECTLVQLETNDDIMVATGLTTVTDNHIGIINSKKPYLLFDRSGKYLCNAGSVGQGPGEYSTTPIDDIIDEKNGLIYISPYYGDKLYIYKTSGEFVKCINFPMVIFKPIIFLYNNILTVIFEPNKGNESVAYQYDINTGVMVAELAAPPQLFSEKIGAEMMISRNIPKVFDFSFLNISDTLYHFDVKNIKILPFFSISDNTTKGILKGYCQLNKDLCLTFLYSRNEPTRIIASDLKNKSSGFVKIVNDYCGNLPISANAYMFRNGYFTLNVQPEQLMDDIHKRLGESSCTEKERQALGKILSSLKENTNNVVFIGKLKSEVKEKLW